MFGNASIVPPDSDMMSTAPGGLITLLVAISLPNLSELLLSFLPFTTLLTEYAFAFCFLSAVW